MYSSSSCRSWVSFQMMVRGNPSGCLRSSWRRVRTHRSANAFAWGDLGGTRGASNSRSRAAINLATAGSATGLSGVTGSGQPLAQAAIIFIESAGFYGGQVIPVIIDQATG